MEKLIRFTKIHPEVTTKEVDGKIVKSLFEFAMYAVRQEYRAHVVHKGIIVRENVVIDAYGLQVTEIMEIADEIVRGETIDYGVRTAHPRHINALIHSVCRQPVLDLNAVAEQYREESTSEEWCKGWPDALAHAASVQLSRDLSTTDLTPFTERIREKRQRIMQRINPLKNLPKPKSDGKELDT